MNKPLHRLSSWNPFDSLRLLWWALAAPQRLQAYRQAHGAADDRRVGKWLAAALIWLPLVVPTLALGTNVLPRGAGAFPAAFYQGASAALLLAWSLTAWLGHVALIESPAGAPPRRGGVVALGAMLAFLLGVTIAAAAGLGNALESNLAFVLTAAICIAEGQAFIAADALMRSDSASALGGGMSFVALGVAVFTALGAARGGRELLSNAAIAGATIWASLRIAESAQRGLRSGRPSPPAQATLVLLAAVHALVVWISLLGGWRLFG